MHIRLQFAFAALILPLCNCQTFLAAYPLGPETAWTRYTWSSLALRFPYERILDWDHQDKDVLYSSSGPHSLGYQQRRAEEAPRRHGFVEPASEEAVMRCTACNILQTLVWEEAREQLHTSGKTPGSQQLAALLSKSCREQTPDIMHSLSKISSEYKAATGGSAPISKQSSAEDAAKVCKSLLEPAGDGGEKHLAEALTFGIRSYASRINGMTGLKRRENTKSFDRRPVPDVCADFHSECRKWAFGDECNRNPNYMIGDSRGSLGHCSASCGLCLVPLKSGDLPKGFPYQAVSAELLRQVQFMGCNASGICTGVDASQLPKISSVSIAPDGSVQHTAAEDDSSGILSPAAQAKYSSGNLEALKRAAESLPSSECFQVNTGWWTYELCPQMHIHQFHVNPATGDIQQTISLGFYNKERQPEQVETQVLETPIPTKGKSSQPKYYVKSIYAEGSKCILEDKETEVSREAEVRMACSLDGKNYLSVSEPSTCKYIVLLRTPALCARAKHTEGFDLQKAQPSEPLERQEL